MKIKIILALVLCSAVVIVGCSPGGGPVAERQYFLLEVQREGKAYPAPKDIILTVRPFALAPGYDSKALTYRTGDLQYESDYYNQFITDVGQQVAEQTRKWLSQSGYFAHVVPPGSSMSATYILEGNINHLYGDFRRKSNAQANVSITFYLIDITSSQPKIVLSKTMEEQAQIADATAESLIQAYQTCVRQILTKFEEQLVQSSF